MRLLVLTLATMALLIFAANLLEAAPITYTEYALVEEGTLWLYGSTSPTSIAGDYITITLVADTSNVKQTSPGYYENVATSATVTISTPTPYTATITDTMAAFDEQSTNITGYPNAAGIANLTYGIDNLDTFDTAFATYALTTSISITDTAGINYGEQIDTSNGYILLGEIQGYVYPGPVPPPVMLGGDSTFTATVPEPSIMAFLGICVISLVGLRRWWKD
jgi:hypothetical protein